MQSLRALTVLILPLLMAPKQDFYQQVAPADRNGIKAGIERYAKGQIKRDWADLYEIAIPGFAIDRDYDNTPGDLHVLSKADFVSQLDEGVANGSHPYMQSFDLVSIIPNKDGYRVRACSKAQRETFHFKGILEFEAYKKDGQIRFGSWRYVVSMPRSCSQKDDQE